MIKKVVYEPTNTEYDQVICDVTQTILRDHIALYPGYISVREGVTTIHYSDDPDNNIRPGHPDFQQFIEQRQGVKNKIAFERTNIIPTLPGAFDGDFLSEETLGRAIESIKAVKEAEVAQAAIPAEVTQTVIPQEINPEDLPVCEMCSANRRGADIEGMTHAFMSKDHPYLDPNDSVVLEATPAPVDNSNEVG